MRFFQIFIGFTLGFPGTKDILGKITNSAKIQLEFMDYSLNLVKSLPFLLFTLQKLTVTHGMSFKLTLGNT